MSGRIRTIKPEFFTDEDLAALSPVDRLAFVGLWTQADAAGRLEDRPVRLRARLFPYAPEVDFEAVLARLSEAGVIIRYRVPAVEVPAGVRRLIEVRNFRRFQRPHPKETIVFAAGPDDPGAVVEGGASAPAAAVAGVVPYRSPDPSHRGHSVCGRVCLPAFLAESFARALGGPDPDLRVRAWAAAVLVEAREAGPIAESPAKWWRGQWRGYVGRLADAGADALFDAEAGDGGRAH